MFFEKIQEILASNYLLIVIRGRRAGEVLSQYIYLRLKPPPDLIHVYSRNKKKQSNAALLALCVQLSELL